jgi:hypothetical protein
MTWHGICFKKKFSCLPTSVVVMVINGEWWRIKNMYLSLSFDEGDRSRKKEKSLKGHFGET